MLLTDRAKTRPLAVGQWVTYLPGDDDQSPQMRQHIGQPVTVERIEVNPGGYTGTIATCRDPFEGILFRVDSTLLAVIDTERRAGR